MKDLSNFNRENMAISAFHFACSVFSYIFVGICVLFVSWYWCIFVFVFVSIFVNMGDSGCSEL